MNSEKLNPLSDWLLVERLEPQHVSAGGIEIPESAQDRPQWALVRAAGPGRLSREGARLPMSVGPGDKVYIGRFAGANVDLDGEELAMVRERDVLAKEADDE